MRHWLAQLVAIVIGVRVAFFWRDVNNAMHAYRAIVGRRRPA